MDVKFINPFIESSVVNIEKLINISVEKQPISVKRIAGKGYDISCIIGLTGQLRGSAVISFTKSLALTAASSLIMEKLVNFDEETMDAIGEITNIIVGHARNILVNDGWNITISTPVIVRGAEMEISAPKGLLYIVAPFKTPQGEIFTVSVSLRRD